MLRSIRQRLLGAFTAKSRRKARCCPPRRLTFENLESRKLLSAIGINDGSFEVPALAISTFQYAPNGSSWQYGGGAGVCSNGSPFGNPSAPDGVQAAFLQSGSMSESVYLDASTYDLSFMAAQRAGQSQYQEFKVLVDGAQVGLVTPTGTTYGSYQTSNFTVTVGMHSVQLVGLNPQGGDNTAFVDEVAIASTVDSISDGGFELPALVANVFQYAPNGSPWQYAGGAGVCSNGSAFGNLSAPDGSQAAFLQGGSMSESVYLDAGTYGLSFAAAQRAGQKQYQEFMVLVDGAQVGLVTPTGTTYGSYQTSNFTVTAGTHTVQFVGLNPLGGDNTAFVDKVAISSTVDSISDGGFETPSLTAAAFQYALNGSPWQYVGGTGVCSIGSAFGNPGAADGSQAAFVQSGGMSESVYLDAGTYGLSFMAAQRAGQKQYQELKVLVDGTQVGLVTPTGTTYGSYQTSNFTAAAGTHTVQLIGLNPLGGDNTAFVDKVAISSTLDSITDGSFEVPPLAASAFQYAPNGSPWQFNAGAGACSNGSAFGNPTASDGSQAAFLQSNGIMSESVYLDAGTYGLSFVAAQRAGQKQYQEVKVLVDGVQVGLVTPAGTAYGSYQTPNFTETAGTHTIHFVGLNPLGGDNTAFVDKVAISPTVDSISDGGFEAPGVAANAFQYAPNGSPWQFNAGAGVCANGSAFGDPNAPNGSQAAFLQGSGSMSESVYLHAGTYGLSFMAAQRAGQSQYQEFEVLVDGAQVGLVTPTATAYGSYQTSTFTVTAGTHTVQFIGLNPQGGDNTAFVDKVAISSTANPIANGSFEAPSLAANAFQYTPNGSSWQFVGAAGVCSNGSAFGNPNAPDGSQAAFLQSNGSMSESVYLDTGPYSLSLMAAQRPGQSQYQEFTVLVDGAQVGLITPTGTAYRSYQTSTFTVTAGTHTLQFIGLNPQGGDNTAFVDEVAIYRVQQ